MDLSSSSSAVNVSFAPKLTHMLFLKRWLIWGVGVIVVPSRFFCNLKTESTPRFETFEIFDFNVRQNLLCSNVFSLNHGSWLIFWCKKHLVLKIMSLPCMLKVAPCTVGLTVVRSYNQIFSAWWVTTISYNYEAMLRALRTLGAPL